MPRTQANNNHPIVVSDESDTSSDALRVPAGTQAFVSVTVNTSPPAYSAAPPSYSATVTVPHPAPAIPAPIPATAVPAPFPGIQIPAIDGPRVILPPHLLGTQDVSDIPADERWYAVIRARAIGVFYGWPSVLAVTKLGRRHRCRVYRTPEEAWLVFVYYAQRRETLRVTS